MQKKKTIYIIILFLIISCIFILSYKIYINRHDDKLIKEEIEKINKEIIINDKENKQEEEIKDDKNEEDNQKIEQEILTLDFEKLKQINPDTVGWIKVDNTNINYPIVKTNNNSYYLNHSFYKAYNINGWIFENSENSSNFDDANTVLFGHNTNSKTMFSELRDIYKGMLGNQINITIYLENNTINYQVFSIYLEKPNSTSTISEYLNDSIVDQMKNKSNILVDIDVDKNDKILTLSTCNNITDDRIILHAKMIN